MSVMAVRGAIQIEKNDKQSISDGVVKLITTIIEKNKLLSKNIISIMFSQTIDLDAMNPAAALRTIGFKNTPLFCTQEPNVQGSMEQVIRVLISVESKVSLSPVYLGEARSLRLDLDNK